jgi:4-hydroxy-tetrahydrodipicolinate synthase
MNIELRGIFPALATPYKDDESLDEEGLRQLVRHLKPHVEGYVVNGTTGDFPLLTPEERRRAVEVVVEEVGGERLVIAGTGAISTHEAVALSHTAREVGADAVLLVAPYYLRPSAAGMQRHFIDVARSVPDLPVLLYNFPQLVGQPIPLGVIEAVYEAVDNVVGMKDTSGDLTYMLTVLEQLPQAFGVLVGRGTVVLPALAAGARGAILAGANLIPERWQRVLQAVQEGDLERARTWQYRNQRVSRVVGKGGSLTVRAGLEMLGRPIGPSRRPLTREGILTESDLQALREALEES